MTPKELDQIDQELAEGWMGWREATLEDINDCHAYNWFVKPDGTLIHKKDFSPTRNIIHAFMVVEEIYKKCNYQLWLDDEPRHFPNSKEGLQGDWRAELSRDLQKGELFEAVAKTKELAISLAAYAALKGKGE